MKRLAFLIVAAACLYIEARGEAIIIGNTSGRTLDVYIRENGAATYRLVSRNLFDQDRAKVDVTKFPFRIAVTKDPQSFSYLGPFSRGPERLPALNISKKDVFETRVREGIVFDCHLRQWVRRQYTETVGLSIPAIGIRGLVGVGPNALNFMDAETPVDTPQSAPPVPTLIPPRISR